MTKTTDGRSVSEIANRYTSLGWELERQERGLLYTTLTFKRDRTIKNREQLNRLQARIEDGINSISYMEESKTKFATIFSLAMGIIAALIFGGGLSLIMLNADPITASWQVIVGFVLGIIGGAAAAIVYPLYTKIIKRKIRKTNPLIEKKKDEISELCGQAHNLSCAS